MDLMAGRIVARIALSGAFIIALAIPMVAYAVRGPDKPETWLVAASALAVLTSVVSTWSSRRVVELQEDERRPSPYPAFDFTGRHGLAMLRVKNTGGTAAHDVGLRWDVALRDHHGEVIGFPLTQGRAPISVLLPGETITQIIDTHHEFIARHPASEFTGRIEYRDPSGRRSVRLFRLDGRQFARTPAYDYEGSRTHFELQKLPSELKKIRQLLQRLVQRDKEARRPAHRAEHE